MVKHDLISVLFLITCSFSLYSKSKNLFSAFRTPAVLFVLVCLLYVLSGLLLFIGLSTFAVFCDCTLGAVMVAMLTWAFIRYSGRYRNVGGAIDQAAGVVLEQVRIKKERRLCLKAFIAGFCFSVMHQLQPLEGALGVVESNETTGIKNKKSGSLNKNGLYNTFE